MRDMGIRASESSQGDPTPNYPMLRAPGLVKGVPLYRTDTRAFRQSMTRR